MKETKTPYNYSSLLNSIETNEAHKKWLEIIKHTATISYGISTLRNVAFLTMILKVHESELNLKKVFVFPVGAAHVPCFLKQKIFCPFFIVMSFLMMKNVKRLL